MVEIVNPHPKGMHGAVLVTGGAKRIGRHICLALAESGYPVAVHYRHSNNEADQLAQEIIQKGGIACSIQGDLSKSDEAGSILESASQSIGSPIMGLVNNASHYELDRLEDINEGSWKAHMDANVLAPLLLIKSLKKSGGQWVTNILDYKISSPNADFLSYTISKFALMGVTEVMARELAPDIRVNAVAPGHTMDSAHLGKSDLDRVKSNAPLGIGPSPDDVASAVSYLASAKTVTGQTIYVDAGERFRMTSRDPAFEGM